jgi:hypothetical protein
VVKELRREGERLETRPSPGRLASLKEVLDVHYIRHRELFEVAASGGKCRANSRIHDADGLDLLPREPGVPVLVFHQYRRKAVAEIFKDGDPLEGFGKEFDEKWKTYNQRLGIERVKKREWSQGACLRRSCMSLRWFSHCRHGS